MAILDYSSILNRGIKNAGQTVMETQGALQGLRMNQQNINQNDFNMQQQRQQSEEQQQQAIRNKQLDEQAKELYKSGDVNAIADFSVSNPERAKNILVAQGVVDSAGAKRVSDRFASVLTSTNPAQTLMQEVEKGEASGLDMTKSKQILSQNLPPEEIKKAAGIALASIDGNRFKQIQGAIESSGGSGNFSVQSSKILEDGSIVAISKDGARQVISPTGEILTGEAAKESIKNSSKQSHKRKIELKRLDQTIKKAQLDDSLLNDQQKGIQRSNIQRLSTLSNTSSGRESAIKKATKFKTALANGEAFSGAGRKAATFVPGVFTNQGQFDEEFNAFSEVAARQQLKASGETRPTDADVQGMKQAMFGIGRDEEVNVQLLEDFIADQIKQNEELDQLIGAGRSGDLSNFTYLPTVSDQQASKETNQDQQALQWANSNPDDPRSKQILDKLKGNR